MKNISASEAQKSLQQMLEEIAQTHEPVTIVNGSANGVLIGEEDWRSIQETLYLLSIPGMRESIREGMKTPIDDCSRELSW